MEGLAILSTIDSKSRLRDPGFTSGFAFPFVPRHDAPRIILTKNITCSPCWFGFEYAV
jgi:hypothetical protein